MLNALRAGVPVTASCLHAGVPVSAHYRAMDAGAEAQELADDGRPLNDRQQAYREYREQVLRARAQTVGVHVALIAKAAEGGALVKETTRRYRNDDGEMVTETEREFTRPDWRASKFFLTTGFARTEFVERSAASVELTGANGGPVQMVPAEEALHAVATRLAAVQATQAKQLPGGWDPEDEDDVQDAELVDE